MLIRNNTIYLQIKDFHSIYSMKMFSTGAIMSKSFDLNYAATQYIVSDSWFDMSIFPILQQNYYLFCLGL